MKALKISLVFIQLAFIISIALVTLFINAAIMEDAMILSESADSIDSYVGVVQALNSFKLNIIKLILYTAAIFVMFQSAIWWVIHLLINKTPLKKFMYNFLAVTAAIGIPFLFILTFFTGFVISAGYALLIIALYLLMIGYMHADDKPFYGMLKELKRIHISFSLFAGYMAVILGILALMYYINIFWLTIILLVVLSVFMVCGKYYMTCLKPMDKKGVGLVMSMIVRLILVSMMVGMLFWASYSYGSDDSALKTKELWDVRTASETLFSMPGSGYVMINATQNITVDKKVKGETFDIEIADNLIKGKGENETYVNKNDGIIFSNTKEESIHYPYESVLNTKRFYFPQDTLFTRRLGDAPRSGDIPIKVTISDGEMTYFEYLPEGRTYAAIILNSISSKSILYPGEEMHLIISEKAARTFSSSGLIAALRKEGLL